jgi:hypothetical protein
VQDMNEYLQNHNEREHNFHTDWDDSGFDICIECDLIRRTGGLYEWQNEELVTMEEYAKEREDK